jgi:hypothetical protein
MAIAATAISFSLGSAGRAHEFIQHLLSFRRAAFSILMVFAVSAWLFFRYYPTPAKPNLIFNHTVLLAYLASGTAVTVWGWLAGAETVRLASYFNLVSSTLCYLGWTMLLTRAGENDPAPTTFEKAARAEAVAEQLLETARSAVRIARATR